MEDLLRQGIVDLVAFCGTNLPAAAPMTPLHEPMENPSWQASSSTQQSIGFISFYIEIPSICWRIDILQRLRLSVFFQRSNYLATLIGNAPGTCWSSMDVSWRTSTSLSPRSSVRWPPCCYQRFEVQLPQRKDVGRNSART